MRKAGHADGDVAARVAVRFDEALESLRLIRAIVDALPAGDCRAGLPAAAAARERLAIGCVEGWRGPVLLALESGPGGTSVAAIRTIRRGRTGRCSSTRSSATSFPTSR